MYFYRSLLQVHRFYAGTGSVLLWYLYTTKTTRKELTVVCILTVRFYWLDSQMIDLDLKPLGLVRRPRLVLETRLYPVVVPKSHSQPLRISCQLPIRNLPRHIFPKKLLPLRILKVYTQNSQTGILTKIGNLKLLLYKKSWSWCRSTKEKTDRN